ncbi:hypothetical protein P4S72_06685 [Vibrio sp. PP-XX7]
MSKINLMRQSVLLSLLAMPLIVERLLIPLVLTQPASARIPFEQAKSTSGQYGLYRQNI